MVSEYERFVVQAMINFYNYDYDMFFEYLDDNVMWFGPKQGQYIVGKENLIRAFNFAKPKLKFHVDNVTTKLISFSSNVYSLLVTYRLYSYYPDGAVRAVFQHVVVHGQKCRDQNGKIFWRCPFIHVSNLMPDSKSAEILLSPPNIEAVSRVFSTQESRSKRLVLPGDNYTSVYIREDAVRYIVGGKGIKCYVHTDDEVFLVRQLLKEVQEQLPDYYYRCHSSYIVNLRHVLYLSSHKITLDDSTEIPISFKRYAQIREDINKWMKR